MSITRRDLLKGVAVGATGLSLVSPLSALSSSTKEYITPLNTPKNPKNILIITADQLAKRGISAYGNKEVKTPVIDSILNTGTSFYNAYCAYPLCAPSRACFWTGKLPHQTGIISNDSPNIPETMSTLGTLFSQVGYECKHFGKRHDYGSLEGFDCAPQIEKEFNAHPAFPVDYDTKEDVYCLEESLKYINSLPKREEKKPFLLAVEFNNPHNINGWTGNFAGEHGDIENIGQLPPLLNNFDTADDLKNRPKAIQYACCTHNRVMQSGKWSEKNFQQYLKAYYYFTELVDSYIGQVINALKKSGYWEDTLVVFFSDHGDAMGAHRLVAKMNWFYEESTNVPFAFSGPGIQSGALKHELTSLCDLLPTLCEYIGIDYPKNIYGRSLYPLLTGKTVKEWRNSVICHWNTDRNVDVQPARMLRTENFKYIIYKEDEEEELYDMVNDRGETQNLSHHPDYQQIKKELRLKLDNEIRNNSDPFYIQEVIINKKWRSHEVGYQHHTGETSIQVYQKKIRPLLAENEIDKARRMRLNLYKEARLSYICEK
ncbi:sulfatase-like hydrolase/transferase [Proteus terrae subsp. cibarius]|uniref:Sulfatase-like hydrolase/transferase n=1 Tax=Proteus terrae subsp. cibarius TaxID=626774 RepID=A0ABX6JPZ9_9GAMM|nr:sulfatase-like hydrolase/transferase [Proteus terrae]QGW01709.1 sulfatase-like hydrolase/transferase [Proteus terrae subsp. cibarius]QIF91272.1 sulfatase-like hydrolase/transferase [Proteus terrae subsp. cibarius]